MSRSSMSSRLGLLLVLSSLLLASACGRGGPPVAAPATGGAAAEGPPAPPPAAAPAPTSAAPAVAADASQCDAVVAKLSRSMEAQMNASLPADKALKWTTKLREVMTASCTEDGWPAHLTQCVLAAQDDKAIDACGDSMKGDKEMEEKLMRRMQPLMDEMMKDLMSATGADPAAPTTP